MSVYATLPANVVLALAIQEMAGKLKSIDHLNITPDVLQSNLAGLFAAGMSSLASVMLIVGTACINDIWNVWKPLDPSATVRATKWAIVFYCVIVVLVTIFPPAGIVELTAFSGAVFAASFFPSIFGGLYLRWGTGHAAFWSMVIGLVGCVVWRFGFRLRIDALKDVHEIIPSFLVSLLAYAFISLMTTKMAKAMITKSITVLMNEP